jgi:hypothetical protein
MGLETGTGKSLGYNGMEFVYPSFCAWDHFAEDTSFVFIYIVT